MHPVTTHPETAAADLAWAIRETYPDLGAGVGNPPVVIFWPGGDTGHDAAAKWLRIHAPANARLLRTLPPRRFLRLLSQATVAVGNSSALVREASYYGTPRLILGDRQQGREGATPPYPGPCTLYGDGHAAPRIAALVRQIVVRRELAE
jgi:UDP-N-acetylglucosamine 2-epimerase